MLALINYFVIITFLIFLKMYRLPSNQMGFTHTISPFPQTIISQGALPEGWATTSDLIANLPVISNGTHRAVMISKFSDMPQREDYPTDFELPELKNLSGDQAHALKNFFSIEMRDGVATPIFFTTKVLNRFIKASNDMRIEQYFKDSPAVALEKSFSFDFGNMKNNSIFVRVLNLIKNGFFPDNTHYHHSNTLILSRKNTKDDIFYTAANVHLDAQNELFTGSLSLTGESTRVFVGETATKFFADAGVNVLTRKPLSHFKDVPIPYAIYPGFMGFFTPKFYHFAPEVHDVERLVLLLTLMPDTDQNHDYTLS